MKPFLWTISCSPPLLHLFWAMKSMASRMKRSVCRIFSWKFPCWGSKILSMSHAHLPSQLPRSGVNFQPG